MNESDFAPDSSKESDEPSPEETELWEAIQEAKEDKVVRPDQSFEF